MTDQEIRNEFWQANPSCKDYFSGYDAPQFGLIASEPRSAGFLNLALQHEPFKVSLPECRVSDIDALLSASRGQTALSRFCLQSGKVIL